MPAYSKKDQIKPKTVIKYKTRISIADLKKKAQRVFNKWIRKRDAGLPCMACNKPIIGTPNASHFIAQGSCGALRFNEDNVWNCCVTCNKYLHGNLLEFRISLVKKIGEDKVKWLEDNMHMTYKWTREELEAIIAKYV